MTSSSWSFGRASALVSLTIAFLGSVALSVLVSVWFLVPLPLITAGGYAAVLGMTPGRFFDALDDRGSGSGTQLPF